MIHIKANKPNTSQHGGSEYSEVLYTHVDEQDGLIGPGHWLFHTGQWAHCGTLYEKPDGSWILCDLTAQFDKEALKNLAFDTRIAALQYACDVFQVDVREVSSKEFPSPEEL